MENEGNNTNAQTVATNTQGAVTQPAATQGKTEGTVTRSC